jgi:hypothetical protein
MMHRLIAVLIFLIATNPATSAETANIGKKPTTGRTNPGWTQLFDGKSFRGWYTKIQNQKTGEDREKYFQVDDGVIHVYKDQADGVAVPNGYLATEALYANYHLRIEYKWGAKRFKPRAMGRRDAGLLYHVTPPDSIWPRCVECQIQENDVGDCFTVRGVRVRTHVEIAEIKTPGGPKKLPRYKEDGDEKQIGDSGIARVVKSSTHEHDGWNLLEIIVRGSTGSEHIVNGHTVFRADELLELGSEPLSSPLPKGETDKRNWEPLARGRIALQCEFAEVYYRNIEIRAIPDGPLEGK